MKIFKYFLLFLLVSATIFALILSAIWVYDNQMSKKIETEKIKISAAAKSKSTEFALQKEYFEYATLAMGAQKLLITEWLISVLKVPNSNAEARIPAPDYYANEILSSIAIEEGGKVTAKFKSFPGTSNAWLRFIPSHNNPEITLSWKCESNIPIISQLRPTCSFVN